MQLRSSTAQLTCRRGRPAGGASAPRIPVVPCRAVLTPSSSNVSKGKEQASLAQGGVAGGPLKVPESEVFFQKTPVQDAIMSMRSWDTFLAAVQADSTLHQDLLSFVAQPWVDRPWFKINTHPATSALFNHPIMAPQHAQFESVVATIDSSLTPAQAKWFAKYMKDISTAPVIYTSMTNLSARVFDSELLDAIDRTVDAALTPERLTKILGAIEAGMSAPVPESVKAATPAGGNPVVAGTFTGFQAYWNKQRRAKYLGVYDTVQTDEHYARVGSFMRQMLPFSTKESLEGLFSSLDAALPADRVNRIARAAGSLLGGTWGLGIAEKVDAALPPSRMENLLLAIDSAATPERFARLPAVLRTVAATLTPPRIERAFMTLEMLLEQRAPRYVPFIEAVTADPARLDKYAAAAERLLTSESAGALMDVAYVAGSSPARLDKIAHLMDLVWGDKHKLEAWLDAVEHVNLGTDGRGEKVLAVADELLAGKGGKGLVNLWSALALVFAPHRQTAYGVMLDKMPQSKVDRAAAMVGAFPTAMAVFDALLSASAARRLMRALDTTLAQEWARKEVEGATDAAIGISDRDGATAILGAAGKILADAHKHMFAEVFGGPKL